MSAVRKLSEPKVDPGLAHWMQRAGIPTRVIAAEFGVPDDTARWAVRENARRLKRQIAEERADKRRAKISASRMRWCPEYLRRDYEILKRKLGTVEARAIIELRLMRGGA